jgi:hypothetical protein
MATEPKGRSEAMKGNDNAAKDHGKPYRYSVGGYFATKKEQSTLDDRARFSKIIQTEHTKESLKGLDTLNKVAKATTKNYLDAETFSREVKFIKDTANPGKAGPGIVLGQVGDNILSAFGNKRAKENLAADYKRANIYKAARDTEPRAEMERSIARDAKIQADRVLSQSIGEHNERMIRLHNQVAETAKAAKQYQSVSSFTGYGKALLNQTKADIKKRLKVK